MEITLEGTVEPASSLCNTIVYCMAALLIIAFFANLSTQPVAAKHPLVNTHPKDAPSAAAAEVLPATKPAQQWLLRPKLSRQKRRLSQLKFVRAVAIVEP